LLLAFAGMKFAVDIQEDSLVLSAASPEDIEKDVPFDTTVNDQVGVGADVASMSSLSMGSSITATPNDNPQTNVESQLREEMKIGVPVTDERLQPSGGELISNVEVRGQSTEIASGGVEGAIDRLAMELANSLRERKTIAIWLFDASLSLEKRRNSISDRFENTYKQLDSLDVVKDNALQTVVATFGEKTVIITQDPVDDVRSVIPKVRAIPNDVSGKENVFSAVSMVVQKFAKYRNAAGGGRRNMLMFIVTDERGDDAGPNGELMEETILKCRNNGIKAFVVGNAAPFGKEKGYVAYTYPDGDRATIDVEVDQGPETIQPEALNLGFWVGRGPSLDKLSSGYGPYALTRLCKETGGLYFIAEEGGLTTLKFDGAIMRN